MDLAWTIKTGPTPDRAKTFFPKHVHVIVRNPDRSAVLFESDATMTTDNPTFNDNTAYLLCQGNFRRYPERVAGEHYLVDMPDD